MKKHHEEKKDSKHGHMHHKKMIDHHMKELMKMAKGSHHQSKSSKMDESLGMRRGKESTKKQSMASRRHESMGAHKK